MGKNEPCLLTNRALTLDQLLIVPGLGQGLDLVLENPEPDHV